MATKIPLPTDIHVGNRVRMRRIMLDMSQTALANEIGLTFQQVQKYEKGTNRMGASRLQQIAHVLQVPVTFFFEGNPVDHAGLAKATLPAHVFEFLATTDGFALTRAYMRIQDAKLRRHIVNLIEGIAGAEASE